MSEKLDYRGVIAIFDELEDDPHLEIRGAFTDEASQILRACTGLTLEEVLARLKYSGPLPTDEFHDVDKYYQEDKKPGPMVRLDEVEKIIIQHRDDPYTTLVSPSSMGQLILDRIRALATYPEPMPEHPNFSQSTWADKPEPQAQEPQISREKRCLKMRPNLIVDDWGARLRNLLKGAKD